MSKLNRTVDGQTIQFVALPKIFQSLNADLPSGKIALPSGEIAYWRLQRNLTELKKHRRNIKELANKLLAAFKTLVKSTDFLNHYGLTEAPKLPTDAALSTTLRTLLQINTNRVDYSTITVGKGHKQAMVETIEVSLGNLVYFNAVFGAVTETRATGIRGKLTVSPFDTLDDQNADVFDFNIYSPVIELTERISPSRLRTEILNKIRGNLPRFIGSADVTFNDGQFDRYVESGLESLVEKHSGGKAKNRRGVEVLAGERVDVMEPATEVAEQPVGDQLALRAFDGTQLSVFLEIADPKNFYEGTNVTVRHDETGEAMTLVQKDGAWVPENQPASDDRTMAEKLNTPSTEGRVLDFAQAAAEGKEVFLNPSDFDGFKLAEFREVMQDGKFEAGASVTLVDEGGNLLTAEFDGASWTFHGVRDISKV